MSNVALNKPILEKSWSRPEELTNDECKNYMSRGGFTHSRWPDYLTVDLQDIYVIETIRFLLYDKDERAYKYRLLISKDLLNWTVCFDSSDNGYKGWQEFYFPEKIELRYIRLHCLWNSKNDAYHIVQLQAFDGNTDVIDGKISNKRIIQPRTSNLINEINDGLPLTQKINNLTNSLERILKENTIINPKPFQEIIDNFRIQANDIESLEMSIDSIRREILSPVKKELEEGKRLGQFSVWGFYIGFVGIIVSIFAILNGVFDWI